MGVEVVITKYVTNFYYEQRLISRASGVSSNEENH